MLDFQPQTYPCNPITPDRPRNFSECSRCYEELLTVRTINHFHQSWVKSQQNTNWRLQQVPGKATMDTLTLSHEAPTTQQHGARNTLCITYPHAPRTARAIQPSYAACKTWVFNGEQEKKSISHIFSNTLCLMYHAACKVEFQPFKRSYSQLTFFNFL